ncbi:MAG: DNA polymerase III subunit gamma/tau [Gallionella sp.]|nr:DNA polymerase III subunit gamma/tau [Gallionella sp.]
MSATTVLARKWRPKNFAQLAGQEHVVKALGNALTQNRLHHAYLFTGTRGVGKTTIARIFAKSLNCESGITATPCGVCSACREIDSGRFVDLIELDAASNTGVDNMRELLENAMYAPTVARFKVYIIDEVHMLSKGAFNAMLKTLEEPPAHVKFILATTDPQKVPVTVLSRCLQFNLKQLPPVLIASHLKYVLEQEQIACDAPALQLLARAAQGSMRDALSLLDQAIAFSANQVEEAVVRSMLGAIDQGYLYDLLDGLLAGDGEKLIQVADDMATRSIAFDAALQDIATLLHRIALAQTVPAAIGNDEPDRDRLLDMAQRLTAQDVQLYYQIAIHGRHDIDLAPDDYAGFSMTLLRMLAFAPGKAVVPSKPVATVAASVSPKEVASTELRPFAPEASPPPVPRAVATSAVDVPDWITLLQQINLQGIALQMARQCVLESINDAVITLRLAQEHKHFQSNKMAIDKLQLALGEYFGKQVKLNIMLGAVQEATPAVIEQNDKDARLQQAHESLAQDGFVRDVREELGGMLLVDTVRAVQ